MNWPGFFFGVFVGILAIVVAKITEHFFRRDKDLDFPYFGLKKKPCQELTGAFSWGRTYCHTLTRRRWRNGRHFVPICTSCHVRSKTEDVI